MSLWEEKLQLRVPFAGNSATAWGTRQARPALCLTCVGTMMTICVSGAGATGLLGCPPFKLP